MHEAKGTGTEGYETTDMKMSVIAIFLIGLGVMLTGGFVSMLLFVRALEGASRPAGMTLAPLLEAEGAALPIEPHLQQNPLAEKEAVLEAVQEHLEQYGIVIDEAEMQRAHIPIERAMELVAAGEAPYRQAPTTAREESRQ